MFKVFVSSIDGVSSEYKPYIKIITEGQERYYIGKTEIIPKNEKGVFDLENENPFFFHFTRAQKLHFLVLSHNVILSDKLLGSATVKLEECQFNSPMKIFVTHKESGQNSGGSMVLTITITPLPTTNQVDNTHTWEEIEKMDSIEKDVTVYLTFDPPMPKKYENSIQLSYIRVAKTIGAYDSFTGSTTTDISPAATYYGPSGFTQIMNIERKRKLPRIEYGYRAEGKLYFVPVISSSGMYCGNVTINYLLSPVSSHRNSAADAYDNRSFKDFDYFVVDSTTIPVESKGVYSSNIVIKPRKLELKKIPFAYSINYEECARSVAASVIKNKAHPFRRNVWSPEYPITMQQSLKINNFMSPSMVEIEFICTKAYCNYDYNGYDTNGEKVVLLFTVETLENGEDPDKYSDYVAVRTRIPLDKMKDKCVKIVYQIKSLCDDGHIIVRGDDGELFTYRLTKGKTTYITVFRDSEESIIWDMNARIEG